MSAADLPAAPAPDPIREPWESLHRQRLGSSLGIWIFLGSEAMLFGGLIMAVVANRALHPQAFAAAGHETDVVLGTLNTAILLTSSLTMAIASEAAQAELRRTALRGFALTLLLGLDLALYGLHALTSDNLWDYLFEPVLMIVLGISVIRGLMLRRFKSTN